MCFSSKEFTDFLESKSKEIHDETWYAFRNGKLVTANLDWYVAKEREILIGEIIRKFQETCNVDE